MIEDKSQENKVLGADENLEDDVVDLSDEAQELSDEDLLEEAQEVDDSVVDVTDEAQEVDDSVVDVTDEALEIDDSVEDVRESVEKNADDGVNKDNTEEGGNIVESKKINETELPKLVELNSIQPAEAKQVDAVEVGSEAVVDKSSDAAGLAVDKCESVDKTADSVDKSAENKPAEPAKAASNPSSVLDMMIADLNEKLNAADVKQETIVLGKSDVLGLVSDAFPAFTESSDREREKLKYEEVDIKSGVDEDRIEREYIEDYAARSNSYMDCLADIEYRKSEPSLDSMPRVVLSSSLNPAVERAVQTISLDDETEELQKLTATEISVAHENSRVASSDRIQASQYVSGLEQTACIQTKPKPESEVNEKTVAVAPRYDIDPSALGHTTVLPRNEVAGAEAARKMSPSYAHQSMLQSLQELIAIERDSKAQVEAEVNQKSQVVQKDAVIEQNSLANDLKSAIESDLKSSIEADLKAAIEPELKASIESDLMDLEENKDIRAHARAHKSDAKIDNRSIAEIVASEWNEEDYGNEEHSVIADLNTIRPTQKNDELDKISGGIQLNNAPKARASFKADSEPQKSAEDNISNYEVISEVDRRGQSVTFQARNMDTNRVETIKLFLPKGYALNQNSNAGGGLPVFKIIIISFILLLFIALVALVLYFGGNMHIRKPSLNPTHTPTISAPSDGDNETAN